MKENQHTKVYDELANYWLKDNLFSNPRQRMILKEGETLLKQGDKNQKLFYLETGQLSGYFQSENDDNIRLFTVNPHMLVGIYSFFSPDGRSYTTVKADKPSMVFYFDKSRLGHESSMEYAAFLKHMLPSIVNEIYMRQMKMMESTKEKHLALKRLYQTEKMATLGQLAAGLAHELNNAIGVLHNKTEWLTEQLKNSFAKQLDKKLFKIFSIGLERGQTLATAEVRKRKNTLIKRSNIDESHAKYLAKLDLNETELKEITDKYDHEKFNYLTHVWEMGLALHDMGVAASHTSHVVKSIKELGAQDHRIAQDFDLGKSINKALVLLKSHISDIEIKLALEKEIFIYANEGKFIQVWVNLIKNAAEVLLQNETKKPRISISSASSHKAYHIYINDNGPGIPSDIMVNIFQPAMTTKVSGISFGMGLGLSIAARIVVAAGGQINVSSEPGNTTFEVMVPNA